MRFLLTSACLSRSDTIPLCGAPDPQYPADPLARPSLKFSIPTQHFIIHWTDTGVSASTSSYAQLVAAYAETSWTVEVSARGWKAPKGDGSAGGDSLYDIYVLLIGGGYLGSTVPEPVGGYSLISNSIDIVHHPERLPFTVAHEFNHGCQLSYSRRVPPWFTEATATWITQTVFPYTGAFYLYYVDTLLTCPLQSTFFKITDAGDRLREYGQALFCDLLIQWTQDSLVMRKIWDESARTNSADILTSINTVLSSSNPALSLNEALRQYAIWRNFTSKRADNYHFKNADSLYKKYPYVISYTATSPSRFSYPVSFDSTVEKPSGPGGCRIFGFQPSGSSLTVRFDGQDGFNWDVYIIGMKRPQPSPVGRLSLDANARGDTTVYWANADSFAVVVVVTDTASNAKNLNFSMSATVGSSVAFSNSVHGVNSGGKFLLDETDTVNSGHSRSLNQGSPHRVQTLNERFVSDSVYKHHDWNGVASRKALRDTFVVSSGGAQSEVANFLSLNAATIRNEIAGVPSSEGGTIQFKDPWYLNSTGVQPDSFVTFSSPLSPTGAYSQTTGGVFLNQDPAATPTYYTVRAPLNQSIGNFQCAFVRWDASGASMVQVGANPAGYDQKAVIFRSRNAVVNAIYQATSATITKSLSASWNLVSVPDVVPDFHRTIVYSDAVSPAFAYTGSYVPMTILVNGAGYWVKYQTGESVNYTGIPILAETVLVAQGWNLIGSLSANVGTSQIYSSPAGLVSSKYYVYVNGSYSTVTTLEPGVGCWVKTSASGQLILDANSSANNPPSASNEQPPCAPPDNSAPQLNYPTDGTTGLSPSMVLLDWYPITGAVSYDVDVSQSYDFDWGVHHYTNVPDNYMYVYDILSYSTTYFWRVSAVSSCGAVGDWSTVWSFRTMDEPPPPPPPPPCDCCPNSAVSADRFTIIDAQGYTQTVFALNSSTRLPATAPRIPNPKVVSDSSFEVRFSGKGLIDTVQANKGPRNLSLRIRGATFPLNIIWNITKGNKTTYVLNLPTNQFRGTAPNGQLTGLNRGIITSLDGGALNVTANAIDPCGQYRTTRNSQGREDRAVPLPLEYSLSQNHPNPFNPMSIIQYELPEDSRVMLKVTNGLGQVVATLADGIQVAGYGQAAFDARSLPSGVYFYRLDATSLANPTRRFSQIKKALLLK